MRVFFNINGETLCSTTYASKQASKQAKFRLSLIALSIFSFSQQAFAENPTDTSPNNADTIKNIPVSVIKDKSYEVDGYNQGYASAINDKGDLVITTKDSSAYQFKMAGDQEITNAKIWKWKEWEPSQAAVLPIYQQYVDVLNRPTTFTSSLAYALNGEGNVAAGALLINERSGHGVNMTEEYMRYIANNNSEDSSHYRSLISYRQAYLLAIWKNTGNGWEKAIDVDKLENKQGLRLYNSSLHALNKQGDVAGGRVDNHAAVLNRLDEASNHWKISVLESLNPYTNPYIIYNNHAPRDMVTALNAEGNIAVGRSLHKEKVIALEESTEAGVPKEIARGVNANHENEYSPVVWRFDGNTWNKPVVLATPEGISDELQNTGSAKAITPKGDVAAGFIGKENDFDMSGVGTFSTHPVIWSGENLTTATVLSDLKGNKVGLGEVNALNAAGNVAAGFSVYATETYTETTTNPTYESDGPSSSTDPGSTDPGTTTTQYENKYSMATLWVGKDWKPYNLGSFYTETPEDTAYRGGSAVYALNKLGTIAVGVADTNEGTSSPAIWRIRYTKDQEGIENSEVITSKTPPENLDLDEINGGVEISAPINPAATQNSIAQFGLDSVALLTNQFYGVRRLLQGCYTDEKGFCYRAYGDWSKVSKTEDFSAGLSVGYQFGNHTLVGATLDHSLHRNLPNSFKHSHSNLGLGLFARTQWNNWYISPAIGWDYYNAKAQRPHLPMTDTEEGRTKVKGFALSLTVGQDFVLDNKSEFGWYAALSQTRVSRSGFQEKRTALEVKFDDMRLSETALALGAKLSVPFNDKLKGLVNVQLEQQLSGKNPQFNATAIQLGDTKFNVGVNKFRAKLQAGIAYEIKPNVTLAVTPYIERAIYGSKRYGAEVSLSGRF